MSNKLQLKLSDKYRPEDIGPEIDRSQPETPTLRGGKRTSRHLEKYFA
jgi:hypothetical protein